MRMQREYDAYDKQNLGYIAQYFACVVASSAALQAPRYPQDLRTVRSVDGFFIENVLPY